MQISAANLSKPAISTEVKAPATTTPPPVPPSQDPISLRRVAALLSMLENNPEIRPEVVARGRALASDPSYPQPEVIIKLAGLMVSE